MFTVQNVEYCPNHTQNTLDLIKTDFNFWNFDEKIPS